MASALVEPVRPRQGAKVFNWLTRYFFELRIWLMELIGIRAQLLQNARYPRSWTF